MRSVFLAAMFMMLSSLAIVNAQNPNVPTCNGSVPVKGKCPTNPGDQSLSARVETSDCKYVPVNSVSISNESEYPKSTVCPGRIAYNVNTFTCEFTLRSTTNSYCTTTSNLSDCYITEQCTPAVATLYNSYQTTTCVPVEGTLFTAKSFITGYYYCNNPRP